MLPLNNAGSVPCLTSAQNGSGCGVLRVWTCVAAAFREVRAADVLALERGAKHQEHWCSWCYEWG